MHTSPPIALIASRGASPPNDRRFGGHLIVLLAIILTVVLTAGGWLYYKHQYGEAHEAMQESLTSIAELKSEDMRNWIHERRGDAEVARFSGAVKDVLSQPDNKVEARRPPKSFPYSVRYMTTARLL